MTQIDLLKAWWAESWWRPKKIDQTALDQLKPAP